MLSISSPADDEIIKSPVCALSAFVFPVEDLCVDCIDTDDVLFCFCAL